MSATPLSLDDYAGPKTAACAVCRLPGDIRQQIIDNELREPPIRHSRRTVVKWAASLGHTISSDAIYRHITKNHS